MPTYGYKCQACGHAFEVLQKITDAALTACESCGGAVKKILYPVGIQFKGSGFYVNDYTNGGGRAENSADPKAETKSEAATETKPDTTPQTKPDSKPDTSNTDNAKTEPKPAPKTA